MVQVKTPVGFQDIKTMTKISDTPCVRLLFSDQSFLDCAEDHLLFQESEETVFAKDSLGKRIISKGPVNPVTVIQIESLGNKDCYDLSVAGHRYWTKDILSHNSTVTAVFLIYYILFNQNKTVAILANKGSTARDILAKLKLAYQNLPRFLQQGIVEWNKGSIELENGSRVIAAASSSSNIRGMSISCLMLDECLSGETKVKVRDKETQEETELSLEDLYALEERLLADQQ